MAAETFRIEIPIEVKDKTDPSVSTATRKMTAFDKVIQQTKKRMDEFNRTKYNVVVEAIDKVSAVTQRIGTTVKGLAGKAWQITMGVLDKATAPIRGIINLLRNPLLQLGAVVGVSVSMTDTINTYKNFEQTMSKVQAVGEMTADQIAVITEKAKEMGATTKYTATEAGEAFTYMAQAGWTTEQMLAGIEGVLSLSAADGLDLASTASIVTDTLAAFGLQASDTAHFADVLAKAAAATNVDVAQMGETFKYVAPIAGAMGYSIEDMSTAIGLMANASVKGSMAGTALKTAISNMVTPTSEQQALMDKLGVTMTDNAGNAKSFGSVMRDLRRGFSKLSETEKTATASTLFGSYAMSGMLSIMNASEESFDNLSESIANAEGTAKQMSEVMLDNLAGSFTLLQSAADGVKISIGQRLSPYLRQFANWLTGKMPDIEKAAGEAMDYVDEKIRWLKETINDFTSGEDWENADIGGKIKIAWDKIVAEPFSQWWNSTGKAWFAEKAASIGESIGSGLKTGILALLGIDIDSTLEDGAAVGKSFIQGFKNGFETDKITEALKDWAKDHKGLIAAAGVIAGGKLLKGMGRGVREGRSLVNDIRRILGKGSGNTLPTPVGGSGAYAPATMTVTASVVNIYGAAVNNMTGTGPGKLLSPLLPALGGAAAGRKLLPQGGTPIRGLLPGAVAGSGAAAGQTIWAPIKGAAGQSIALGSTGSAIVAGLAKLGIGLGSEAATVGGAAAAGAGATGGILGVVAGGIKSIVDLVKGIRRSRQGNSKDAKTSYITAGTGAGMMGAGAGIGAAVGSVVPGAGTAIGALIGGGIGGIASLFASSPVGQWLSDATDEGGWLDNTAAAVGEFFETTLPEKWGEFWGEVGDFFAESIPYALGYATAKVQIFFTETVPGFFGGLWEGISTFFGSTLPTWASTTWNEKIVPFFTDGIPGFFGDLWESISGFFTTTLPTWASDVWNGHITPFFSETIPGFFSDLWERISSFFASTIPSVANEIWGSIKGFFTDTIPGFFSDLWDRIGGAFGSGYIAGGRRAPPRRAAGGVYSQPHMAYVAEAGPESIIPLSPSRRARGIDLWQDTGRMLGVQQYAYGGIVGDTDGAIEDMPATVSAKSGGGGINVKVEVSANPEFKIDGSGANETEILTVLKSYIRSMTDDIGDELADRLSRIFENMPITA